MQCPKRWAAAIITRHIEFVVPALAALAGDIGRAVHGVVLPVVGLS
ncbi:MAG: hypothetical protein V4724_41405 [Pseudomonadota bacterium]